MKAFPTPSSSHGEACGGRAGPSLHPVTLLFCEPVRDSTQWGQRHASWVKAPAAAVVIWESQLPGTWRPPGRWEGAAPRSEASLKAAGSEVLLAAGSLSWLLRWPPGPSSGRCVHCFNTVPRAHITMLAEGILFLQDMNMGS